MSESHLLSFRGAQICYADFVSTESSATQIPYAWFLRFCKNTCHGMTKNFEAAA